MTNSFKLDLVVLSALCVGAYAFYKHLKGVRFVEGGNSFPTVSMGVRG